MAPDAVLSRTKPCKIRKPITAPLHSTANAMTKSSFLIERPWASDGERAVDIALLSEFRGKFLVYLDSVQHLASDYSFEFSENGLSVTYTNLLDFTYGVKRRQVEDTKIAIVPRGTTHLGLNDDEYNLRRGNIRFLIKVPGQDRSKASHYGLDVPGQLFGLMTTGYRGRPFFPVISIRGLRTYEERTPSIFLQNLLIDEIDELSELNRNNLKQQIIQRLFGNKMPSIARELLKQHVRSF